MTSARIYRPSFHENKPKTLAFSNRKRAFWACFRENWVYKFGHRENILFNAGGVKHTESENNLKGVPGGFTKRKKSPLRMKMMPCPVNINELLPWMEYFLR
jgi:hypothetical protein